MPVVRVNPVLTPRLAPRARQPLRDGQGTQTGAALQLDEQTKPASSGLQSVLVVQGSAQIFPSDVQPPSAPPSMNTA